MDVALRPYQYSELLCQRGDISEIFELIEKYKNNISDLMKNGNVDETENTNAMLLERHIGGGVYCNICVKYRRLNIRQYWLPENEKVPKPTKKGIVLNNMEWQKFLSYVDKINSLSEDFKLARTTSCFGLHGNQFDRCSFCDPFGIRQREIEKYKNI